MYETILVVEDSRTQAMLLEEILKNRNYKVTVLPSGEKAMIWLSKNKASLVISDIVMPGMNGFNLCKNIKSLNTNEEIPVILLTSLNGTGEVIEGLIAGADSFITKPYDQDYLILHIEKIITEKSGERSEKKSFGVEIVFEGKKRIIQADQQHIVKLLLNIYDGAIQQNTKLFKTQDELKLLNENLESAVQERTSALIAEIESSKMIEESLRESDAKFNTLVSKIPVGVYILRSKPNGSYALEFVSPRMAEILDLSVESLKAHSDTIFKVIHPEDLDEVYKLNQEGIRLQKPFDWKGRVIIKGQIRWVNISSLPQQLDNGDILWHGLIVDITESKESEEKLRLKNEELLKINAEKDKFFSIIAHDLRSPLSSFMGFTELLVEDLPNMELEDLQEMAVAMQKSATNLYRLIENLLEWSKVQRGLVQYNPKVVQLKSIVDEIIEMQMESVNNKKLRLTTEIPIDLKAIADENMLKTIIRNLLSNAVKFTPLEGGISISAKITGSQSVEFSIQDTGIGMSSDILDHLFQLNNQTNRTGTQGESSSGLGLLLCKEFIEKLGGQIRVKSQVGNGTNFTFTLPYPIDVEENIVNELSGSVSQVKIPVHPEVSGLKILIADDDIGAEMLVSMSVRVFGKEILKAKNGLDAVEVCRNNPDIDLVMMDLQMPKMDGYEATRLIRKFNKEVIIIAQAGFVSENDKELAIKAGCNDYISKPVKKDKLLKLIQKYFKKIRES